MLTAAAAVKLGLPERLEGHEQRRSLRLPEDHAVVKQVAKAKWQLTQRGFGPWARVYRKAAGSQRQCVQLAVLSWDALDERSWPGVAEMEPADVARVLGVYAQRVINPRGSTPVSSLELMAALRPPTKPERDEETGNRETGAYLDPWPGRPKTAYVDSLADLGVTRDLDDRQFLAAMERHRDADPAMAAVLAAIKATVKGGVGKLRERPQGKHYKDGDRWPALQRQTWRPDIRAAVISKARVNMHRKLRNMAAMTGL